MRWSCWKKLVYTFWAVKCYHQIVAKYMDQTQNKITALAYIKTALKDYWMNIQQPSFSARCFTVFISHISANGIYKLNANISIFKIRITKPPPTPCPKRKHCAIVTSWPMATLERKLPFLNHRELNQQSFCANLPVPLLIREKWFPVLWVFLSCFPSDLNLWKFTQEVSWILSHSA